MAGALGSRQPLDPTMVRFKARAKPNAIGFIRNISVAVLPDDSYLVAVRFTSAKGKHMSWNTPLIEEICVGMEVTSYESADLEVLF